MITARVIKYKDKYKTFICKGHAEYDDAGKDIVCAAISMLVLNTANSIEKFTDSRIVGSDDGCIRWDFADEPDDGGRLLMDSLMLGLKNVEEKYGPDHIKLIIENK